MSLTTCYFIRNNTTNMHFTFIDETPLPSPNSTPVHIHEVTHTRSPHSEDDSEQIIVDRLSMCCLYEILD